MSRQEMNRPWYASPYTGLFAQCGPVPRRPHDPEVAIWSGAAPLPGREAEPPPSGGAGWDEEAAEAAGVGEAVERWQSWPLPCDQAVEANHDHWPLDEPAVAPQRWVLFHPEQYALPGFPFAPFTGDTVCRWVCFREAGSGLPVWVPEELAYLSLPPGACNRLGPMVSSGLSCGRADQPVLLRGVQELIERDAITGAWWGSYPLEEHDAARVLAGLDPSLPSRLLRPNLRYRFYRVGTPLSAHVTLVTLEGEDREGYCFSTGSACRETRAASWLKSILEAVQGRHYVRYLRGRVEQAGGRIGAPTNFAEHALYYSLHPEHLAGTVLGRAVPGTEEGAAAHEGFAALADRLGPGRAVLFRILTPPGLASAGLGWLVLRVLVPGLQPLHGHHGLPFLGGPLWSPRGLRDWGDIPPHPFA
jgi:ribosomal protein S12 methylthiotransferase accessory factor